MSRGEVRGDLGAMSGRPLLMASVLYGSGRRLTECCRPRVKDVDFERYPLVARYGMGDKDRDQHRRDRDHDTGWVELPDALHARTPHTGRDLAWHGSSPATRIYHHPATNQRRRHHFHESGLERAVRQSRAGHLPRRSALLRHRPVEDGSDIRTLQQRLGHADVLLHTHLVDPDPHGVKSPMDSLVDLLEGPTDGTDDDTVES